MTRVDTAPWTQPRHRKAGLGRRHFDDARRFRPGDGGVPARQSVDAHGGRSRHQRGLAGQAVTATAVVALVTSLLIVAATRRIDRRLVLLAFSILLIVSNLLVAFAPDLPFLLAGRVLLGVALGGFWTMSAAVMMRLVPEALVPRALSIMFSGVSAATILAAPVGSYLGDIFGWRSVFLIAAALGVLTLIVQFATLPPWRRRARRGCARLIDVLRRPGVGLGMIAIALVFTGHFALFTYVRPFLETVTGVGISAVSGILLGFGIANFLGTYLGGLLLSWNMRLTLTIMPLVMGILGLGLAFSGGALWPMRRWWPCGAWLSGRCRWPGPPGSPAPFLMRPKPAAASSSRRCSSPSPRARRRRRDLRCVGCCRCLLPGRHRPPRGGSADCSWRAPAPRGRRGVRSP